MNEDRLQKCRTALKNNFGCLDFEASSPGDELRITITNCPDPLGSVEGEIRTAAQPFRDGGFVSIHYGEPWVDTQSLTRPVNDFLLQAGGISNTFEKIFQRGLVTDADLRTWYSALTAINNGLADVVAYIQRRVAPKDTTVPAVVDTDMVAGRIYGNATTALQLLDVITQASFGGVLFGKPMENRWNRPDDKHAYPVPRWDLARQRCFLRAREQLNAILRQQCELGASMLAASRRMPQPT
jgi:hypothetical protein